MSVPGAPRLRTHHPLPRTRHRMHRHQPPPASAAATSTPTRLSATRSSRSCSPTASSAWLPPRGARRLPRRRRAAAVRLALVVGCQRPRQGAAPPPRRRRGHTRLRAATAPHPASPRARVALQWCTQHLHNDLVLLQAPRRPLARGYPRNRVSPGLTTRSDSTSARLREPLGPLVADLLWHKNTANTTTNSCGSLPTGPRCSRSRSRQQQKHQHQQIAAPPAALGASPRAVWCRPSRDVPSAAASSRRLGVR